MVDVNNVSGVLDAISPALLEKVEPLIIILKAVGIVFLLYVIYLIVRGILTWKDRRRLKRIEEKLLEIDNKLERVLDKEKSSKLSDSKVKDKRKKKTK